MLGESISDPQGVEEGGEIRGMGLLPMHTVFAGEKTRTRVEGTLAAPEGIFRGLAGQPVEGYEIHMGVTTWDLPGHEMSHICDAVSGENKTDGGWNEDVYGSYIHGFFDRQEIVHAVISALAEKKGIAFEELGMMDYDAYKQQQYDILAEEMRKHLDMPKIYRILEEGI